MGGVQTSAADYARWTAFLLSAWPARDDEETGPVRRSTVRELASGSNFPMGDERPGLGDAPSCRVATAYGMGMMSGQDCELGQTLAHSGGYPGYGSYLLLMPETGIGIFAFANRTYAAPVPPVEAAALELHRAGLLEAPSLPISPALGNAYRAAGACISGHIGAWPDNLAMNF